MSKAISRKACRVAVVDDSDFDRHKIIESLEHLSQSYDPPEVIEITSFGNAHRVAQLIRESIGPQPPWDIILADVLMPHPESGENEEENGGFYVARAIRERYGGSPVPLKLALVTSFPGFVSASKLFEEFDVPGNGGWFWFFVKGETTTQVRGSGELLAEEAWGRALMQLIRLRNSERWGLQALRSIDIPEIARAVFRSAQSINLLTSVAQIGGNPGARVVTVTGETGTGKEIIARLLHSHRTEACNSKGQFIICDVPGYSTGLLEVELFGYDKHAASPGTVPRKGRFELAAGGTLFLDEIQELSLEAQAKLLRVIEDNRIPKVGASQEPMFQGNLIILATTAPLRSTASGGVFREDLLGRIGRYVIHVPLLRERSEDILPAAELFLSQVGSGSTPSLSSDAKDWLRNKSLRWPQNFRTLRNLMNRASEWGAQRTVTAAHLEEAAKEIGGVVVWRINAAPAEIVRAIEGFLRAERQKRGALWAVVAAILGLIIGALAIF